MNFHHNMEFKILNISMCRKLVHKVYWAHKPAYEVGSKNLQFMCKIHIGTF
jgi:hypothetical protein